jgi:crotonobetainyl-CoA:carnitine CoA-transferase CaiB-like acyl-CoA transferase
MVVTSGLTAMRIRASWRDDDPEQPMSDPTAARSRAAALTRAAWTALGGDGAAADTVAFRGGGALPSCYGVTDFAAATMANAALAIAELLAARGAGPEAIAIDRRLASLWFAMSIRPTGWTVPAVWDPIAGDYRARDGWIRLHTNAPHHRAAAERVLGRPGMDKASVAEAVARWAKAELESAIVAAGGCAAEMRSVAEWAAHPQGSAVAAEPLAHIAVSEGAGPPDWPVSPARPLRGLRVLDLTRVLAGPVATRCLAAYGAEVLRIDPPDWDEPAIVPEVTLGKSCARLDLRRPAERAIFESLLSRADIMVHGYRPGALDRLGLDAAARRSLSPGLVDICLDAYGWSGPWATRRGFDSLVQMSSGIAETGMRWRNAERPVPLPVQALDHGTGYLIAAAAIRGVTRRLTEGRGTSARLSLARTARFLVDASSDPAAPPLAPETEADLGAAIEATGWGPARRLVPAIDIAGTPMRWDRPATMLGSAEPRWAEG